MSHKNPFFLFWPDSVFAMLDIHCPFLCSIIHLFCGCVHYIFIHATAKNVDQDKH